MSAVNCTSTVLPSPASATKFQTAGGPIFNETRFCKFSAVVNPSAVIHARMRLAKICRSTGNSGFRFAPNAQSYLEFTLPKSAHKRAMPPRPLVSKIRASAGGLAIVSGKTSGCAARKRTARRRPSRWSGHNARGFPIQHQSPFPDSSAQSRRRSRRGLRWPRPLPAFHCPGASARRGTGAHPAAKANDSAERA